MGSVAPLVQLPCVACRELTSYYIFPDYFSTTWRIRHAANWSLLDPAFRDSNAADRHPEDLRRPERRPDFSRGTTHWGSGCGLLGPLSHEKSFTAEPALFNCTISNCIESNCTITNWRFSNCTFSEGSIGNCTKDNRTFSNCTFSNCSKSACNIRNYIESNCTINTGCLALAHLVKDPLSPAT